MSLLVNYSDSEGEEEGASSASVNDLAASIVEELVLGAVLKKEVKEEPCQGFTEDHRGHVIISDSEEEEEDVKQDQSSSSSSEEEESDDSGVTSPRKSPGKNAEEKNSPERKNKKASALLSDSSFQLPPIEELHITVPEEACERIGMVESIVDDLVVVRALPGTAALDLDSILFLEKGRRTLGKVFDVIGRVSEPNYCVRFNSAEHVRERLVEVGAEVFCAPKTEHAAFVFVEQLRRMKGSDASWKNDKEPPQRFLDYSDDEEEREARRGARGNRDGGEGTARNLGEKRDFRGAPASSTNPFYRRGRHYNPRDYGPIRWNSMHTPPVAPQPHGAGTPAMVMYPPPPRQGPVVRPPVFVPSYLPPPTTRGNLANPFSQSQSRPEERRQQGQMAHYFGMPPPPPPSFQ